MSDNLDEDWRPIPGFPAYSVSSLGRVRSERNGRMIKTPPNHGYPRFNGRRDGKSHIIFVHQAVLLAFVGPPPAGTEVRHLDGNRGNPRLDNLSYGTRAENIADAKRHGTFPVLEQRPGAILTREQAVAIAASTETAEALAARFGVRPATIQQIRRGETWEGVTKGTRRSSYRPRGDQSAVARLTEAQVREIVGSSDPGRALARRFGVTHKTIANIRKGRTWQHVTREEIPGLDPATHGP